MARDDAIRRGRATMRSGRYLPRRARRDALRPLIVATDHDDPQLDELAARLLDLQLRHPHVKPILLVAAGTSPSAAAGSSPFVYESCLGQEELRDLGLDVDAADYRRERIATMVDVYAPSVVLELQAGELPSADMITTTSP